MGPNCISTICILAIGRKEIVEHTYSKSISMVLTHLSKLFEINLKLNFNYQKLKICFMSKCVDLPPIICAANADRFSGNFYNCCCRSICKTVSGTKTPESCRNRRVCGRLRLRTIDTTLGIKITSCCF